MKKLSTVLLLGAAIGALALAACGDDSSSSPSGGNGSEGRSSASGQGGASNAGNSSAGGAVVDPTDSSLVVPTDIAPISVEGTPKFSADCGEDANRIKSVDADAYIDFACAVKIEPGKGETVNVQVKRGGDETPQGWNITHSFDGDRPTSAATSGPYDFSSQASSQLNVKIMPPNQGYMNVEIRLEDADNAANAIVIPFIAVRTK